MSGKPPPVTDHAVLRYLQRVAGVNVEVIRRRIWLQARGSVASGANRCTIGGITYYMQEGVVTTVTAAKLPEPETLDDA